MLTYTNDFLYQKGSNEVKKEVIGINLNTQETEQLKNEKIEEKEEEP